MARKRYKKKRKDYRKGGRVKYAHGGKPSRRDYESTDEYQIALEQWRNDPAHQGTSKAPVKPMVTPPASQPAPQPAPVQQPAPRTVTPRRTEPFQDFDPADKDLRGTIGDIAPKLGRVTAPSTVGTITPAAPASSRPSTYLNIPSTQTQLGLDPSDSALLGINQQVSTDIENKGLLQGVGEAIQKYGLDFVANPEGTVFKTVIEKGPSAVGALIETFGSLLTGLVSNKDLAKYQQDIADQATAAGLKPEEVLAAAKAAREEIEAGEAASGTSSSDSGKTEYQGWSGSTEGRAESEVSIPEALGAFSISPAAYLYGGVGSSFEANRDAYTESGQYDIDKAARDAAFDAMRAARGESVPRTKEETQQLLAEQRERIGRELAGGTMSPAATTPISSAMQQAGQAGQDLEDGEIGLPYEPPDVGDNTSRQKALDIIEGRGQGPQIPDPSMVQTGPDATTMQMGEIDPITGQQITTPTLAPAVQAQATQADAPTAITPTTMEAAQVTAQEAVPVATGDIGDKSLAQAAQVDQVAPIEAVEVEIPQGALTERVVGTLSPNAIAIAAQAAGTTLSRVTRAKKQLRNAGISEQAITDLGNDPEALEDRLMDLTEQERGVIGDLPEEALVSNQLDSLLKGMESGEIPTWANPAVAAVEQMLAQRGLSASTVGRDNLFNAIIQSAVPIAQSNAQAIQANVAQTREIESREEIFNAQARQQTALQNANNVFKLDLAQFSADQQTALANSKYLQTVSLTEANLEQQAAIQNATIMARMNLADADFYQKAQIQNAQAFLGMDMANLNNEQQSNVLTAQMKQQAMLSNQAATNAARQFNATSENQTQQFMTGLASEIEKFNSQQATSMSQFNAQVENANNALRFNVEADIERANAAMITEINKFNAQVDFNREQWNKQNAQTVEQSNIAWRRQANTINTAAANQVSMQNAMNAFNLNNQALSFLWQELRDQATFNFQRYENEENRKAELYAQAIANEGQSAGDWEKNISSVGTLIASMFGKVGS